MQFISSLFTPPRWPFMAFMISLGLLCGAWFFQYVLDYAPCQMCYWQRHAHKAVLIAALLSCLVMYKKPGAARLGAVLIGIAFLVSFSMAFWHVGVEYGWWEGPKTCAGTVPNLDNFDPESFLKSLEGPQKMPACSEAAWQFIGLSMAGWNALISLIAALLSFIIAQRKSHV